MYDRLFCIRDLSLSGSVCPRVCRHYRQLCLHKLWRVLWIVLGLSALGGCQSFSYQTLIDNQALNSEVRQSAPFQHRLFWPTTVNARTTSNSLHIYIEGDGQPWIGRYFMATDPTPEYSLMLEAMLQDSSSSVYLGRPCYYHLNDETCTGEFWTMARYSQSVVDSMVAVVEELARDKESVWLIGHSGGGTLAMLIGRRLSRPVNVLTVAANLNHQAWTDHHHYTPLFSSLDVTSDTARNSGMKEMHWVGNKDQNVLPQWNLRYCREQGIVCREIEAKHSSGWLQQWPRILREAKAYFKTP